MNIPAHKIGYSASFITALALAAISAQANAAEQQDARPADVASQPAADTSPADIVVTAQRRAQRLQDVPISIVAKTAENLRSAGVLSVKDIEIVTPGLNYSVFGTFAQPAIRGVTSTGLAPGNENNVAVYLDDVYQPVQFANLFEFYDIDRIEVLKGPQGTLFGRNATGGAIRIITLDPTFETTGKASITGGFYDNGGAIFKASAYVNVPLVTDRIAASITASYGKSDGYVNNIFTHDKHAGGDKSVSLRGKLLVKLSDSLDVVATGFYSKRKNLDVFEFRAANNLTPAITDPTYTPPQKARDVDIDTEPTSVIKNYGGTVRAKLDLDIGTLTSTTALLRTTSLLIIDADGSSRPLGAYHLELPDHTESQELSFASEKWGGFSFLAGAQFYRNRQQYNPLLVYLTSPIDPPVAALYVEETARSFAGYVEGTYEITPKLTAIAGVRYTTERRGYSVAFTGTDPGQVKIGKTTFSSWTPRFSVKYDFADRSNIYFTYSQGFKSGLYDSASFSSVPIKPEKIKSYELGLKTQPMPGLTVNVAGFLYDFKDLQMNAFDAVTNLALLQNASNARIKGVDLDASLALSHDLTLSGGLSWLPTAKYKDFPNATLTFQNPTAGGIFNATADASGFRMVRAAKLNGNVALSYRTDMSFGKFEASGNVHYTSSFNYDLAGVIQQSKYATVNTMVAVIPNGSDIRISLFARNLTNKKYLQNVQTGTSLMYTLSAPRQIGVSAEITF